MLWFLQLKKDSLQCVYYLHQQQLLTLLMQLIIPQAKKEQWDMDTNNI